MGNNMDTITFFKTLKESDWKVPVTKKWQVKDVLSHLVGWKRECTNVLEKVFEIGNEPWFMSTDNYDKFNDRIYREFENYSPDALISELEKWQEILEANIQKFGENKIRLRLHMNWVFDEGDEPHFEHHVNQVKNALKNK
jgi:hypothetical protein